MRRRSTHRPPNPRRYVEPWGFEAIWRGGLPLLVYVPIFACVVVCLLNVSGHRHW